MPVGTPNRNVFLFGAGVSADASIPMLNGFVDRMLDIATRQKAASGSLDELDSTIFAEVRKVRDSLDDYHGRAAFNDRNIEDLLSILALGANSQGKKENRQLNALVRAIARTIDLECMVPVSDLGAAKQRIARTVYGNFWKNVINKAIVLGSAPTIVSLNYDLVLERALIGTIPGAIWNPASSELKFPFKSIRIAYHCANSADCVFNVEQGHFYPTDEHRDFAGYRLSPGRVDDYDDQLTIPILKLHGSLNFPKKVGENRDVQLSCDDPLLMPPVFNKTGERALKGVWEAALDAFRSALNVVICGYSLPKTDIYMQYFLKAALGPNRDLRRITVFDPVLHREGKEAVEMRDRFANVFSEQIRSRIEFEPQIGARGIHSGTFRNLADAIGSNSKDLLFL